MTLEEFKIECKRTCPTLGDLKLDLSHMVLGINSEINELEDAIKVKDITNIGEEIADGFWYVQNYLTFRNKTFDFSTLNTILATDSRTLLNLLYRESSLLNDMVKKYIAYDKVINDIDEEVCIKQIHLILVSLLAKYNLSLSDVLDRNIEKLRVRFPEKFTTEKALNRDLVTERRILEGNLDNMSN